MPRLFISPNMARTEERILRKSKVSPKKEESLDSIVAAKAKSGNRRAFDVLMEAQSYWNMMDSFRQDRERNKKYAYGKQWDDKVTVDGKGCANVSRGL